MRTRLVLQPFAEDEALIEVLQAALMNEAYESFIATVAWARPSGLLHLVDGVDALRERGGTSEILVGIDEGGATVEGLQMASEIFDQGRVLYDPSGGTFHPKIYVFRGPHEALLVIGSNNLTAGGLYFNYEAAQVLTLDLALTADARALAELDDYLDRLRADDTCLELSADLIEYLASEPRFRVSRESERKRSARPKDDSVVEGGEGDSDVLFGSTKYRRKAFKSAIATSSRAGATTRTTPRLPGGDSPEAGGSTAKVVARWTKKLTRSDCGQPRPGSNTTGALRFTKARHPISQATWFRQVLFSDAGWAPDPSRAGRERASIRFDVEIYGVKLGTHVLALKYDAQREADQNNFTTDLKWGSLTQAIIAQDLVGSYVAIERLDDDTYRMRIEAEEPEGFLDELSA